MSLFPGVKWDSKEYKRLYSARRRKTSKYSEYAKDYRLQNKEYTSQYKKEYKLNMTLEERIEFRKRNNTSSQKSRRKNPAKKMWFRARDRAKRKGLEFNLDISDVVIPKFCPVFGYELKLNDGRVKYDSMTLDRIDNTKGYIKGNVMVVSHRANTLKNDATLDELKRIVEYYGQFI